MKAAYVAALVVLAFVAGALLSGVSAHTGGMMGGWSMAEMMDACSRMMEGQSAGSS